MRYNVVVGVQIALDFFPARVTLPSGAELGPVRVYVADGRVLVYHVVDGVPKLHFDRELLSSEGNATRGMHLQVADGSVRVVKDRGCGCGHPLKRFNPWPNERRTMVAL